MKFLNKLIDTLKYKYFYKIDLEFPINTDQFKIKDSVEFFNTTTEFLSKYRDSMVKYSKCPMEPIICISNILQNDINNTYEYCIGKLEDLYNDDSITYYVHSIDQKSTNNTIIIKLYINNYKKYGYTRFALYFMVLDILQAMISMRYMNDNIKCNDILDILEKTIYYLDNYIEKDYTLSFKIQHDTAIESLQKILDRERKTVKEKGIN
jgi:hypothetical protein